MEYKSDYSQLSDQWYEWQLKIDRLYARQDQANTEFLKGPELVRLIQKRTDEYAQGNEKKSRDTLTRTSTKISKVKNDIPLHKFEVKDGMLYAPLCGHFGIIKTAFYRVIQAMGKAKYWSPPTDLLAVFGPNGEDNGTAIGKAPIDRISVELQSMHSKTGGMVMVPVAWEVVENRALTTYIKQNAICPLGDKEINAIIHGTNSIPFGPNKRGTITTVQFGECEAPKWNRN